MSIVEDCCSDVLQSCLLQLLDPSQVCQLATCCKELLQLSLLRRTAILLARHQSRVCLRRQRVLIQQRELFAKQQCNLEEIEDRVSLQDKVLQQLQASPDGIRDLAAAVQQALATVTHQTAIPPAHLQHMQQDLVRMANFVCLLAWRLHLRSRRARRLHQQQQQQLGGAVDQPHGHLFADAAFDEDDAVVVILDEGPEQHIQALQQEQQVGLEGAQQEPEHVQGLLGVQGGPPLVVTVHVDNQHLQAGGLEMQQQQQQHLNNPAAADPAEAPVAAPAPAHVSVSVQTDDLGPTMREVRELLSGLSALMQPDNPSLKPGRATLALLNHHITQQLQAWNLQQQQHLVLPAPQ